MNVKSFKKCIANAKTTFKDTLQQLTSISFGVRQEVACDPKNWALKSQFSTNNNNKKHWRDVEHMCWYHNEVVDAN